MIPHNLHGSFLTTSIPFLITSNSFPHSLHNLNDASEPPAPCRPRAEVLLYHQPTKNATALQRGGGPDPPYTTGLTLLLAVDNLHDFLIAFMALSS